MIQFRANSRVIIAASCSAAVALSVFTAGSTAARSFSEVKVRGAEFIAEENIRIACEIETEVDYTPADLEVMQDCLMNSGQFDSVRVAAEGSTLVVTVDEINDRPGRIDVGLAYNSRDGALGTLYFERYNLFPGTFGAIELSYGEETRSLQTHLYHRDAFNGFDIGLDTLLSETDFGDQGFKNQRLIVEPYLAYPISDRGRLEFGIGYRKDKMSNIAVGASPLLFAEEGEVSAPFIRLGARYSSSPVSDQDDSSTGFSLAFDQYFWGLGTDFNTAETRVKADARFALADDIDLLIGVHGGVVSGGNGASTRASDRFFIGGSDFRGFAARGIGPKDGDYFVGANQYIVSSIEVQKSLGDVLGKSTRIGAFIDVGSAWGLDNDLGGSIDDNRHVRSSAGLSLTFDVAEIPVSVYVAKPIDMEAGDEEQNFGISFSSSF